jgi:hypothetical protein
VLENAWLLADLGGMVNLRLQYEDNRQNARNAKEKTSFTTEDAESTEFFAVRLSERPQFQC